MRKPDPFEALIWLLLLFVGSSVVFACVWFGVQDFILHKY